MNNPNRYLWQATIIGDRLTTSGSSFSVSKDSYSGGYRNFIKKTIGVRNEDKTLFEFMVVTHTDGVVTIHKRGLDDDGVEQSGLKREWLDGTTVYLTEGPWDMVDADDDRQELSPIIEFKQPKVECKFATVALMSTYPDAEVGMSCYVEETDLYYDYTTSGWGTGRASGVTPLATEGVSGKVKIASLANVKAKIHIDGAAYYVITPEALIDERTVDVGGAPTNAGLIIVTGADGYIDPSFFGNVTAFTDELYQKYGSVQIKSGDYSIVAGDGIVEYTGTGGNTLTLPSATDYSYITVKRILVIKNRGTGSVVVSGVVDGITNMTLLPGTSVQLYSNGTNWYSATLTPVQYIAPDVALDQYGMTISPGSTYTAGEILPVIGTNSTSWIKFRSMTCKEGGTFQTYFEINQNNNVYTPARIYKNGLAYGTLRAILSGTTGFTEDLTFAKGDTIELWGYATSGYHCYVQNFKVRFNAVFNKYKMTNIS